jgi:hypothetical protein
MITEEYLKSDDNNTTIVLGCVFVRQKTENVFFFRVSDGPSVSYRGDVTQTIFFLNNICFPS